MPYPDASDAALEFEVLIARGVRRGRLTLDELEESFAALPAQGQRPDVLDLISITESLAYLPADFTKARTLHLVASLQAFELQPIAIDAPLASAWLDEKTLLVACPAGLRDINGLVYGLSVLARAIRIYARCDNPPTVPDAPQTPTETSDAARALCLGVSLEDFRAAQSASKTSLESALTLPQMPELRVHAGLQAEAQTANARSAAAHILSSLAELGLGRRPVLLWFGTDVLTDALSPYPRDLAPQLLAWAARDLQEPTEAPELYGALAQFLATDSALAAERVPIEQALGLHRLQAGPLGFDIVDLGRAAPKVCDPALTALVDVYQAAQAPVLLRLDTPFGAFAGPLVDRMTRALGPQLVAITVVTDPVLARDVGEAAICPRAVMPWHARSGGAHLPKASERVIGALMRAQLSCAHEKVLRDVPMDRRACAQSFLHSAEEAPAPTSYGLLPLALALERCLHTPRAEGTPVDIHWLAPAQTSSTQDKLARIACALLNALLASPNASNNAPKAAAAPKAKQTPRSTTRLRV